MKETNKKHILLRYSLVVGLVLAFSVAIVWDMFKTAVVYGAEWNSKADSVLTKETPIEPERGKLLADNGTVLAANLQYYIARIDWLAAGMKKDSLDKYLPAESELARRGIVAAAGNYVALFISPDAEQMQRIFLETLG